MNVPLARRALAEGLGTGLLATIVVGSAHIRSDAHLWLGEVVATAGLVLLVFSLARTGRGQYGPAAVGAYIGAAYWFTSSTSFANPAVTIARAFTNTFAGIAPGSIGGFIAAQLVGAAVGAGLVLALFPQRPTPARPLAAAAAAPAAEPAAASTSVRSRA